MEHTEHIFAFISFMAFVSTAQFLFMHHHLEGWASVEKTKLTYIAGFVLSLITLLMWIFDAPMLPLPVHSS